MANLLLSKRGQTEFGPISCEQCKIFEADIDMYVCMFTDQA